MTVSKKAPKSKNTKSEAMLQLEEKAATTWLEKEIDKAKDKPVSGLIELTPAIARVLLQRNPNNRHISYTIVERFARDITNGAWQLNGEPIIVSAEGMLNDGQHRAEAVVMADKSISTIMIVGVQRDTRTTLDQGHVREIGDYLAMEGHVDTKNLGAVAGLAWQWKDHGSIVSNQSGRGTKGEIKYMVDNIPRLAESLAMVPQKGSFMVGGRAALAFMRYAICQVASKQDADSFIYAMISGENLPSGSPILYARARFSSGQRLVIGEKVELLFRTWNAYRKDETVRSITLQGGELPLLEA